VTEVYRAARKTGMRNIEEDGLLKVARGVTSVKELLRVTRAEKIQQSDVPSEGEPPSDL
jgi:hypothetical protein